MRPFAIVAALLTIGALAPAAQQTVPQGPPLPHVEEGMCPGEYCAYGQWTAMATVLAIAKPPAPRFEPIPAGQTSALFVVNPGEVVTAVTGTFVTLVPGRARITKPVRARLGGPTNTSNPGVIDIPANEVVLTFSSTEGSHLAWFKGQWFTFEEVIHGVMVSKPQTVWWVKIRNARGQEGWTDQAHEFRGIDRLSGLAPATYPFYLFELGWGRPWIELKPGVQLKPFVGETGTFVIAELEPGAQTFVHHHTQEQFDLGLEGDLEISVGGHVSALTSGIGAVVPADAEHFLSNRGATKARLLEFQPVRRFDLLPPRPLPAYAIGPEATHVALDQLKRTDFGSVDGWTVSPDGVRSKTLRGAGAGFTIMDLPVNAKQPVTIRSRAAEAEQFFYPLSGGVEFVSGTARQELFSSGVLLVPRTTATLAVTTFSRTSPPAGARLIRFDSR